MWGSREGMGFCKSSGTDVTGVRMCVRWIFMPTVSFISANYVARALDYNGETDWMGHDRATVRSASPERFLQIAQDVVGAGFEAIDIWTAHCHWLHHDREDYLE